MEKIFKTAEITQRVLAEYEESRDDDFKLYAYVIGIIGEGLDIEIFNKDFLNILLHAKNIGLPAFETVSRCRRKAQKLYPNLRASKEIEEARRQQEESFIEFNKCRSII